MNHLDELIERYPVLSECSTAIETAFRALSDCYASGGKLLVCGNGGSAADADHIVGELMKGYLSRGRCPKSLRARLAGGGSRARTGAGRVACRARFPRST